MTIIAGRRGSRSTSWPGRPLSDVRGRIGRAARTLISWLIPEERSPSPARDRSGVAPGGGAQSNPGDLLRAAYDAHQREIYSFALRSTRDADAAADVVQEAFLRLLREIDEGRTPDNVRAWLYRVASNLVINTARKTSALNRIRHIIARPESTIDSPEREAVLRERDHAVQAALDRLAPDARMGLLLAAEGFSGREIAAAIGRSELATRSLMCRARLDLRQQLEPLDPLGGAPG